MSDPQDPPDLEPLEPFVREMLAAEGERAALPEAVSADIAQRLSQTLGLAGGWAEVTVESPPLGYRSAAVFWSSVLGALGLGALGGATAVLLLRPVPVPTEVEQVTPVVVQNVVSQNVVSQNAVARDAGSPAPPRPAPASPSQPKGDVAPSAPTARDTATRPVGTPDHMLRQERLLLELARTAYERGRTADAESALREHVRRFADGRLREERESLRVLVLVKLERYDDARRIAARFQARYPSSVFGPLVALALQSIP